MSSRLNTKEFTALLARRMNSDEATAAAWLDAVTESLYDTFKRGQSVTLTGFGGFYVRSGSRNWTFKFNPGQKLRASFGWSSSYKGEL